MIGTQFYHETIRTSVAVFGSLFNNIVVKRRDGKVVPVPLAYGPRVKWLDAQNQLTQSTEAFENLLPRMSYEMTGMSYDSNRKLNNKQSVTGVSPLLGGRGPRVNAPVPYELNFKLYIQTKNLNDGWQIIEQILPFFQPAYTVRVRHFPDTPEFGGAQVTPYLQPLNEYDMPITLEDVTWTDDYQGEIQERRNVQWELTFNTKTHLWGPVVPATIIVDARVDIGVASDPQSSTYDTLLNVIEAGYYNQTPFNTQTVSAVDPESTATSIVVNDLTYPDPRSPYAAVRMPPQRFAYDSDAENNFSYVYEWADSDGRGRPLYLGPIKLSKQWVADISPLDSGQYLVRFFGYDPTYQQPTDGVPHPPIVNVSDSEGGIFRVVRPVEV